MIVRTAEGLFCEPGGFYIDPWRQVDRAVITHGHSDHARWGMQHYLAARESEQILRHRLGQDISLQTLDYGERLRIGDVHVSLHPAGHILGSAQVRVEYRGHVTVVTGDFKREADSTARNFELVPCHGLISECTFGLPVYKWPDSGAVRSEMLEWWRSNASENRTSVIYCYSLGKAQRVLAGLDPSIGPIWVHGAIEKMNDCYRQNGVFLPECSKPDPEAIRDARGTGMVLAPPSTDQSPWMKKFGKTSRAMASGWMQVRGRRRNRALDRGFVLSDHSDWDGLIATIMECGCESVRLTHGYTAAMVRWLQEKGIDASALETEYAGESGADAADAGGNDP